MEFGHDQTTLDEGHPEGGMEVINTL